MLIVSLLAAALAAPTVPIQGALSDPAGVGLAGAHTVTFGLYTAESGGAPLWTETATVTFYDGAFAYALGAVTPLNPTQWQTDDALWLEVTEGGVPASRVPVAFAARALHATNASNLNGRPASDYRTVDWLPGWSELLGAPADNAALTSRIQAVAFDAESELTALLDDNYRPASYVPTWAQITGTASDNSALTARIQAVALDAEAELTALLDDNYRPASYVPSWAQITGTASDNAGLTARIQAVALDTEAELTGLLNDNYEPIRSGTTCRSLFLANNNLPDGMYTIDPDGAAGIRGFQVWCDMANGGWTRIDQDAWFGNGVLTEGSYPQYYRYRHTTAQINAIRAASTTAKQDYRCQTLGVGGAYTVIGWDGTGDTFSDCWAADNAGARNSTGTVTTFARIPYQYWNSGDCGDVTESCAHNVNDAWFR